MVKSTYRQFISVACVMLMIMAAFHVMTSGAEATDLPSSAVEGGEIVPRASSSSATSVV